MSSRRYDRVCERCRTPFVARISTARYCSENCVKRESAERHRATCRDCGKALSEGSAWSRVRRCKRCQLEGEKAKTRARAQQIAEWWAAGESIKQIAARLGWSIGRAGNEFHRIRARGEVELPFRRTPSDPATDRRYRT